MGTDHLSIHYQADHRRKELAAKRVESRRHQKLGVIIGDQLTYRDLRRALRSASIKTVIVPLRVFFGRDDIEIEVPKAAILKALEFGDEDLDWTTEFTLVSENTIKLT